MVNRGGLKVGASRASGSLLSRVERWCKVGKWNLLQVNPRTLQGDRVVLGKVGACTGHWSILLVKVSK